MILLEDTTLEAFSVMISTSLELELSFIAHAGIKESHRSSAMIMSRFRSLSRTYATALISALQQS